VAGDLPASFRYAAQGLIYGFRSQRNFRIHVFTGLVVFSLGLWLRLSLDQLAVLVLTVAAVLVLELINTATEAVVDLAIGRRYHPLARIA
jgi:diacylglycerol kinase (ATP)